MARHPDILRCSRVSSSDLTDEPFVDDATTPLPEPPPARHRVDASAGSRSRPLRLIRRTATAGARRSAAAPRSQRQSGVPPDADGRSSVQVWVGSRRILPEPSRTTRSARGSSAPLVRHLGESGSASCPSSPNSPLVPCPPNVGRARACVAPGHGAGDKLPLDVMNDPR